MFFKDIMTRRRLTKQVKKYPLCEKNISGQRSTLNLKHFGLIFTLLSSQCSYLPVPTNTITSVRGALLLMAVNSPKKPLFKPYPLLLCVRGRIPNIILETAL